MKFDLEWNGVPIYHEHYMLVTTSRRDLDMSPRIGNRS